MTMKRMLTITILFLSFACAGCSTADHNADSSTKKAIMHPAARVATSQNDHHVTFIFSVEDDPGSAVFAPASAIYLTIRRADSGQIVWDIRSLSGKAASLITFGVIPDGFTQDVPGHGGVPQLEPGVEYKVAFQAGAVGLGSFTYRAP